MNSKSMEMKQGNEAGGEYVGSSVSVRDTEVLADSLYVFAAFLVVPFLFYDGGLFTRYLVVSMLTILALCCLMAEVRYFVCVNKSIGIHEFFW